MGRNSIFTREEKIAAVKLLEEDGRSAFSVANALGVHENTINKWRRQYEADPERAFTGNPVEDSEDETKKLKRRIKELESEVDFLKKVSAYFARGPK